MNSVRALSAHGPLRGVALVALVAVVPALAACGSGPGSGSADGSSTASPDARLASAGSSLQKAVTTYRSAVTQCKTASSPVVCLEKADRTLGDQVHTYANLLAVGHGFSVPAADLTKTRNSAQTLANSLEILGDAQPTQANYDQVLNTFNVNSAIAQLDSAVSTLRGAHGG